MERRKKRWLLGYGCGCGVLSLIVVSGLTLLGWAVTQRRKPGPIVEVVTSHPGLPAASIEKTITNRIERWCNLADGSEKVTSRSLAGVSIVRIRFRRDIDPNMALTQVQQLALAALPALPPDTVPPVVLPLDLGNSDPVGVLALSSTADDTSLRELANEQIRERLMGVSGAAAPVVLGGKERTAAATTRLRLDGRAVVGVPVYPQQGAKRKDISDKIANDLSSWQGDMPPEVRLRWTPLGVDHKWLREQDNGLLRLYVRAPSHSSLAETEKRAITVADFLDKSIPANERDTILSEVGMTTDWSATRSANAGPMDATIFVQLSAARSQSAADWAVKLRALLHEDARFADLGFRFASLDMPQPVNIRVSVGTTRNAKEALRFAQEVQNRLVTDIKGTVDWEIVQRPDAPTLTIRADSRKAASVGLSCRQVIAQVAAALKLSPPAESELQTDVGSGDPSATLLFQLRPGVDLGAVADTEVVGAKAGFPIKLSSLANVQMGTTAVEIDHEDLLPVLNVRANIEGRNRGDVVADIRKMLTELQVPQGMRVELVE